MVTLLCFCCDHRNPAGARFCNACGTPLHLKPCRHCEAINTRAAAHCHQCGETFALEYLAPDPEVQMQDAPDVPGVAASLDAKAGGPPNARPAWRGVVMTRSVVVLLCLTATALLSAYYAYRHPGAGLEAAGIVEFSQPADSAIAPPSRPEATPLHASTPPDQGPPATPSAQSRGSLVDAGNAARGDVTEAPLLEAPLLEAPLLEGPLLEATTPKAASARPRAGERRGAKARTAKPAKARTAKPKSAPARHAARPARAEPVATSPPAIPPQAEPGPLADSGPIALQQAVSMLPVRSVEADSEPVLRPSDSAGRSLPAPDGGWDRPCAEGVALEPGCDVRMMPKGN